MARRLPSGRSAAVRAGSQVRLWPRSHPYPAIPATHLRGRPGSLPNTRTGHAFTTLSPPSPQQIAEVDARSEDRARHQQDHRGRDHERGDQGRRGRRGPRGGGRSGRPCGACPLAIGISVSTIGAPSSSPCCSAVTNCATCSRVVAPAQLVEGLAAADADVHLAQGDAEFVRPGALVLRRRRGPGPGGSRGPRSPRPRGRRGSRGGSARSRPCGSRTAGQMPTSVQNRPKPTSSRAGRTCPAEETRPPRTPRAPYTARRAA